MMMISGLIGAVVLAAALWSPQPCELAGTCEDYIEVEAPMADPEFATGSIGDGYDGEFIYPDTPSDEDYVYGDNPVEDAPVEDIPVDPQPEEEIVFWSDAQEFYETVTDE
jgi:hypothetical protein